MERGLCRAVILFLAAVTLASAQHAVRIVGGQNGNIQDFPWQASVRFGSAHVCGGSIISPIHILTAAHCVPQEHPVDQYEIVVGTTSLTNPDSLVQTVLVDAFERNPSYTPEGYSWDIAVITLKTRLVFNSNVQPITLPSASSQFPAGLDCKVTGWGHTQHGVPLENPLILQVGQVKIISRQTCNCLYDINPSADSISYIQQDMICAGTVNGAVDACQGDSGGPLVCKDNNGKWFQAGVVSWGEVCGSPNKPGVFMKSAANVDWIRSKAADVQVEDFTIDKTPEPDVQNGCIAADGQFHQYPNSASVVLVTLGMLPLYWLTAYFLTDQ